MATPIWYDSDVYLSDLAGSRYFLVFFTSDASQWYLMSTFSARERAAMAPFLEKFPSTKFPPHYRFWAIFESDQPRVLARNIRLVEVFAGSFLEVAHGYVMLKLWSA